MTDLKLVEWLKNAKTKGHSYEELQDYLIKNGREVSIVKDAIAQIKKSEIQKHHMENQIFMSVAIILILGTVFVLIAFFTQPICGDLELEDGETAQTCCLDAGCELSQTCELNENPTSEQAANLNFFSRDSQVYSCVDK